MTLIALRKGDQERVIALLILVLLLPWLPGFIPRTVSFSLIILQLYSEKRIAWRFLLRSLLAPLAFLALSSMALLLGNQQNIADLISKSLLSCMLLLIMSRSLSAAQWMTLAQTWQLEALLFTLILVSSRWMALSTKLWDAMNLGWRMRSQLSGIRNSLKNLGWRLAGLHQLHDMRVVSMDMGWQARALPPILGLPAPSRINLQGHILAKYLGPPLVAYAVTTLVLRG